MKEHHKVEVIRIQEVKPHPNADKLEIIPIEGYQAVVGKGQFKVGDLAYYIPPDSVVPEREEYQFLWKGPLEGPVPLKRRRITAKRLRGEWSEGLLMPTIEPYRDSLNGVDFYKPADFALLRSQGENGVQIQVAEGDDVATFFGITHWDTEEDQPVIRGGTTETRKKKWPTTWRGWINYTKMLLRGERREAGLSLPVYDVEAYKKHTHIFQEGEMVIVTEKIHGSNARYSYREGPKWLGKYAGWAGHMYAGSRNLWKAVDSTCAWRRALKDNPWIEEWCKAHPGYALYGEITPTQKGYDYGSNGKVRFFLFDVRKPNGEWASYVEARELFSEFRKSYEDVSVPLVMFMPFNLKDILSQVDQPSLVVGTNYGREGIVIKAEPNRYVHNLGRVQLKIVSNAFLEKDSK